MFAVLVVIIGFYLNTYYNNSNNTLLSHTCQDTVITNSLIDKVTLAATIIGVSSAYKNTTCVKYLKHSRVFIIRVGMYVCKTACMYVHIYIHKHAYTAK